MEASIKAKELLIMHYEKISGVPISVISKMVQFFNTDSHYKTAKECALITVKEILNLLFQHHEIDYWKTVKAEIEKL